MYISTVANQEALAAAMAELASVQEQVRWHAYSNNTGSQNLLFLNPHSPRTVGPSPGACRPVQGYCYRSGSGSSRLGREQSRIPGHDPKAHRDAAGGSGRCCRARIGGGWCNLVLFRDLAFAEGSFFPSLGSGEG